MSSDDNVNVPNLGPAEPMSGGRSHSALEQPEQELESSNGFIQPLVIIILIVAVCALGYFGFDVYQAQLRDETTFRKAEQQMVQLQALIKKAEQSAAQSGEKLQGDVSSLGSSLRDKEKQLGQLAKKDKTHDSEIAKLWVVAHQKNKPLIAQQAKEIASLKKSLASIQKDYSALKKSANALQTTLQKQNQQLQDLALAKEQTSKAQQAMQSQTKEVEKTVKAEVAQLSKLIARIETETRANNEFMQEEQAQNLQAQRALVDRVVKLESKNTTELARRVKQNEQNLKAFDSTRGQLNRDLLFVKQKLNNLQLKIEKGNSK